MNSRTLTPALAGLLAVLGSIQDARGLPPEGSTWLRLESANFITYSDAPESKAREVVADLERFRATLDLFHPGFSVASVRPTYVYVFRNDVDYKPYKPSVNGRLINVDGYFQPGPDANYVSLNVTAGPAPLRIVHHEYTHYFLENNLAHVPVWLNEGIAEFYSTFEGDARTAKVGLPVREHVAGLTAAGIMPLAELFAVTESSSVFNEEKRVGPFYGTSWALVHYLMAGGDEHRLRIDVILEQLRLGRRVEEALQEAFAGGNEALEHALIAYLKASRFPYSNVTFKQEIKVDTATRVITLPPDQTLAVLGDLLAHGGPDRIAEAEAHLQQALKLNPSNAFANARIGYLRYEQNRFPDAVRHLEMAVSLNPDDYFNQFFYSQAILSLPPEELLATGDPETGVPPRIALVREHLARAITLQPHFSEAYVMLGESYAILTGDVSDGIAALEQARRLVPARMDIAFNLLQLYLRHNDRGSAQVLFDTVIARSGNETVARGARNALAEDTPGPGTPGGIQGQIEGIEDRNAYGGQVDSFNQAVGLANKGNYKGAVALLEKQLPKVTNPDLATQYRMLLERLKKDAARLGKPLR